MNLSGSLICVLTILRFTLLHADVLLGLVFAD
jgi:hypothetical protein